MTIIKHVKSYIKPVALIVSVALAAFTLPPVQAAEADQLIKNSEHKKWYLGVGLGATKLEPRVTVTDGFVKENSSSGFKLYGGYQFNHALSMEAFYADLGASNIDVVTDVSDVDYQAYGIGLGYGFKLNQKLRLLGKLGVGTLENEIKEGFAVEKVNENTVYLGAGLEYRINKSLSWRIEYEYYDKDYQMLSGGLKLHF